MKKHLPTQYTYEQVTRYVGMGLSDAAIAQVMQISEKTLQKYYSEELSKGAPEKVLRVAQTLYAIATDPLNKQCVDACKYFLERRGGELWRKPPERSVSDQTVRTERPVIDSSKLTPEQREQLKAILKALEQPADGALIEQKKKPS